MNLATYQTAAEFLTKTKTVLEAGEAVTGLLLGICLRLKKFPDRIKIQPYLATVEDEQGLILVAVMTPPHNLVLYSPRPDPQPALDLISRDLLANNWPVPGLLGPTTVADLFVEVWANLSNDSYKVEMRQRVYELKEVTPAKPTPGYLRPATEADVNLVREWAFAFQKEALGELNRAESDEAVTHKFKDGEIYIWDNNGPVSTVSTARPSSHGISVNLVYTPPDLRRRGYASASVAALSQQLIDSGWHFCTLFTDLANPTSNRIYQAIGYRPVCDFVTYHFQPAGDQ